MKALLSESYRSIMDSEYNPLRYTNPVSRFRLMMILSWMWSMVFCLSFLSIAIFQWVWLAHLLLLCASFTTIAVFKYVRNTYAAATVATPKNRCVWDLEREC